MRRLRPWPIIFVTINLIFLIWLITGAVAAGHSHCDPTLTHAQCTTAKQVGGTIAAGLIIALWAAADVIMGAIWAVIHFSRRKG